MADQIDLSLPLQRHILAAVLRVPGLLARVRPVLNPDHFPDPAVSDILAWSLHHWDEHKQLPSKAALLDVFKADEDAQTVVRRAYKADVPDPAHIESRIVGYARHRALRLAVAEAARVVSASGKGEVLKDERGRPLYSDPDAYIAKLIDAARGVGAQAQSLGEFIDEGLEAGIAEVLNPRRRELFYTGFQHLDESGVSVERGEIGCVLGVAKGGKSQVLLNIALAQLSMGYDVVYYNLEMREDRLRDRWYRRIAGSKVDQKADPQAFVAALRRRFPRLMQGRLLIKRCVAKTFTPSDMRAHLNACRAQGFNPAVCIVDYVGIMKPDRVFDDVRFNLASLWLDFRAICQEFEMGGWSAAQVNRGGVGVELVTMRDIAECFEIVQHIDVGFSISMRDDERAQNAGRFFIFASRNDSDGTIVDFKFDFSRSLIKTVAYREHESSKRVRGGVRVSSPEEAVDAVMAADAERKGKPHGR